MAGALFHTRIQKRILYAMEAPKRIFCAIMLDDANAAALMAWMAKSPLHVQWTPHSKLHITVIPPWKETHEDETRKIFRAIPMGNGFDLVFTRIEAIPDRSPRKMWASGEKTNDFEALAHRLETALAVAADKRSSSFHCTLAKIDPADPSAPTAKEGFLRENITCMVHVDSVSLIESTLLPDGSVYKELERIHAK